VPADWLEALPGETIVAARSRSRPRPGRFRRRAEIAQNFADNPIVGAAVASGAACVFTDFRIHPTA